MGAAKRKRDAGEVPPQRDILEALVQSGFDQAHRVLLERRERSIMPLYHLITGKGESMVIGCPWGNEREKHASFAEVKRVSHEHECTHAMYLSEAWMVAVPAGKDPMSKWPAAEQPDRVEIVQVVATDGIRTLGRTWKMLRDPPGTGRVTALEPMSDGGDEPAKIKGAMIDGLIYTGPGRAE